jgi:succinate dehydrogenase hydrophobic anchor subunit
VKLDGGEPFHEEVSDSVIIGGTQTYTFPVASGASEAKIVLDGDDGPAGANDIDLTVRSPNDREWTSEDSGADEQVILDAQDLMRGGAGDYLVEIAWFLGLPRISFTLTIDVEYGVDQLIFQGPDLAPGEKHTFAVPLKSISKGENTIKTVVSATAYYEHSENEDPLTTDSNDYTLEESWNIKVGDKLVYEPPKEDFQGTVSILLLERITGLLAGLLLIFSIAFCGYFKPLCNTVEKFTNGRANRCKWHCRISLLMLITASLHGIMLPFSPHARSLKGLALGTTAFLILTALGYFGWQQGPFRKKWGAQKWSKVHLFLTILAVIIVAIHAILEGSDFAWLR